MRRGCGRIIEQATWRCKRFYAHLLPRARPDDPFIVVPLMRLPAAVSGDDVAAQLALIRTQIDQLPIAVIDLCVEDPSRPGVLRCEYR